MTTLFVMRKSRRGFELLSTLPACERGLPRVSVAVSLELLLSFEPAAAFAASMRAKAAVGEEVLSEHGLEAEGLAALLALVGVVGGVEGRVGAQVGAGNESLTADAAGVRFAAAVGCLVDQEAVGSTQNFTAGGARKLLKRKEK